MADRRDIREAFYGELESAVSGIGFIGAGDIQQTMPEDDESLPKVVHTDDYRKVPMNQASEAPHDIVRDGSGFVQEVVFYSMEQAQFAVLVAHNNEDEKETLYEAIRRHFEKYEHPAWDSSDIQSDVHDVSVGDATSEDDDEREPVARSDRLIIRLGFKRDFRLVRSDLADGSEDGTFADNIEQVDHLIDADNDGTTDETYTTT